jgi:hypothetical protein
LSLSPFSEPEEPSGSKGDELANFYDVTDEEIEQIRQVVIGSGGDPHIAVDEIKEVVVFESSSDSDDEEWDADDPFAVPGPKILTHLMKEPIIEFHPD